MNLQEAMQSLYGDEINCGLECFWDGGWKAWIGDEMNGYALVADFAPDDWDRIAQWFISEANRLYPQRMTRAA